MEAYVPPTEGLDLDWVEEQLDRLLVGGALTA